MKITAENKVKLGNYPGMEYTMALQTGGTTKAEVIAVGQRMYYLECPGMPGVSADHQKAFFESFKPGGAGKPK